MTLATLLRPRISFRHQAPWMRLCARAVLAGWLLPLVFALFASLQSVPARAQDAPVQSVVVLDFATNRGVDPLLGRKAADALAVELQRTGEYQVVTRQRLQEIVGQQAGLQPPFNDTAQVRLAQAVGATSVFSGQITGLTISSNQSARVGILVRQLDAGTGDYINGTQNVEPTEQKLTPIANEVLIDEAINKVTFAAVRSLRQTTLPFGTVLNTTREDLEVSIGTRNGVAVGQRYTVLRDVFNAARNITERVKIGEVRIGNVEFDQATASLSAGGQAGIRTGDFVREIFTAPVTPLSLIGTSNNGSSSPVTAAPVSYGNRRSLANGSLGKGILGVLGLAALVSLVGFGGGSNNTSPNVNNPFESNPTGVYPQPTVRFTNGFNGIAVGLQGEAVVGYIVYRGMSPNFAATADTIEGFIDARNNSSGSQLSFSEPLITNGVTGDVVRTVDIYPYLTGGTLGTGAGGGNNGGLGGSNNGNNGGINGIVVNIFPGAVVTGNGGGTGGGTGTGIGTFSNTFVQTPQEVRFTFTQQPLQIGQQYFYRLQRISAERVSSLNSGNNSGGNNNGGGNNGGGNNNGNTTNNVINLLPFRSPSSTPTGGYTPLLRPLIVPNTPDPTTNIAYDLANLSITLNATPDITQLINTGALINGGTFFGTGTGTGTFINSGTQFFNNGYGIATGTSVATGVDTFQLQISTTPGFSASSTFVSQDFGAQTADATGNVTFTFPNGIVLPNGANFTLGTGQLYVRALSRNSMDAVPTFRISPTVAIPAAQITDSRITTTGALVSRFVNTSKSGNGLRIGPNRGISGALVSGGMNASRVGRPR